LDGSTSVGIVKASSHGNWSLTTKSAVSNTVHTFTAQEVDQNGYHAKTSGDAILGSTQNHRLTSTAGDDLLVGVGHADTFVFAANFGNDVIKNFHPSGPAHDTIEFSKSVFDSFASVLSHATQSGHDIVVTTGNDTLTLKNTKLDALNNHDFHFA
jgi:hypothetical protein